MAWAKLYFSSTVWERFLGNCLQLSAEAAHQKMVGAVAERIRYLQQTNKRTKYRRKVTSLTLDALLRSHRRGRFWATNALVESSLCSALRGSIRLA